MGRNRKAPTSPVERARKALAQRMERVASTVLVDTIEAEMGAMCRRSFFEELHRGVDISQASVDEASRAFMALTDRLMPAALVHLFIKNACAMGIQPRVERIELAPGFTTDETLASSDVGARLDSRMRKFTRQEVLDCLAWNQAEPRIPVALAHLVNMLDTYGEVLRSLVARRSPEAAERLRAFTRQWASKNVLKFVNLALSVMVTRRAKGGPAVIDQALITEALDLLNRSGSFTWHAAEDPSVPSTSVTRINCPARAFLHRLIVDEGGLMTLITFVFDESAKDPRADDLQRSLDFVRRFAEGEAAAIREHGAGWRRARGEVSAGRSHAD